LAACIRIRIPNADSDPGGLKRKKEVRHSAKRKIILLGIKSIKNNSIRIKMCKCGYIFIKNQQLTFNLSLKGLWVFNYGTVLTTSGSVSAWIRIPFKSWIRIHIKSCTYPDPHKVNADPKHWYDSR
jgi:hypothetical protein